MKIVTYCQKDIEEYFFKKPIHKDQVRIYNWFKRNNKLEEFYELKEKARINYLGIEPDIEKTFKMRHCKHPDDWQYKRRMVRTRSKNYAVKVLNLKTDGLEIHHCYGMKIASFVLLSPENHQLLHSTFGRRNEDCLISNKKVAKLISKLPHILVENGKIIENTMKSTKVDQ